MKFTKENLSLEEGLKKEWIITNGLGGFSSSTIIGANTRKYHGLLIAPLLPPGRRYLILSKLDESLEISGEKYDLYTNVCKEYISKGYNYQVEFEKEELPIFRYKVKDVEIEKTICLDYGKNTVGVYYKIKNGKENSKITLAPVINFRDFHQMRTDYQFVLKQNVRKTKVKLIVDNHSSIPVYMHLSEGEYKEHYNDTFWNMFYIEEEKRGFEPEENHIVPGVYEVEIKPNEEKNISFVCSLEENIEQIDVHNLIEKEKDRIHKLIENSELIDNQKTKKTKKEIEKDELIKTLVIATDNFVAYRPSFSLHTIIAGYPWFLDWGRDALISFEGILLKTKRYDMARELMLTGIRDVKYGLVPNGYSGYDSRPLYNSVDASLLMFEQVEKYIKYTGDYKFIEENIYEKLEEIIENYCQGIDVDDNNIYLDSDGLIVSGTEDTQNTWMDAKYDGVAVTPRNGKAVEINALWYNANMIMANLSKKLKHILKARKYKQLAENCKISFNNRFYNLKKKCLYDVLGDDKIRPNQLFALSLTYPIIDPTSEIAKNVINTVEKKLLNNYGLKTLAKGEEKYVEVYEGSPYKRDTSYHQGITWPWLLGLYYDALKNMEKDTKDKEQKEILQEKLNKFIDKTYKNFKKEIYERGCIGSIAEIYDSSKPQLPKGAISQAWSISEIFRIIIQ